MLAGQLLSEHRLFLEQLAWRGRGRVSLESAAPRFRGYIWRAPIFFPDFGRVRTLAATAV